MPKRKFEFWDNPAVQGNPKKRKVAKEKETGKVEPLQSKKSNSMDELTRQFNEVSMDISRELEKNINIMAGCEIVNQPPLINVVSISKKKWVIRDEELSIYEIVLKPGNMSNSNSSTIHVGRFLFNLQNVPGVFKNNYSTMGRTLNNFTLIVKEENFFKFLDYIKDGAKEAANRNLQRKMSF